MIRNVLKLTVQILHQPTVDRPRTLNASTISIRLSVTLLSAYAELTLEWIGCLIFIHSVFQYYSVVMILLSFE